MSSELPPNTPEVKIDGVTKSFSGTVALEPVCLKIHQGEFLTLLGPSGCGKTTLLNLIAGFLEADKGELFINQDLFTQMPPHQREIGILFQNYALFPHMSVAQNIAHGLRTRRVPKAEITKRMAEALSLVKLGDFADRRPRHLSVGQQQRVALARALVIWPRVLLLDEPFSALDRNLRTAMQVELKEIQSRLGLTTIFVAHHQSEALSMSDRIAVMSQGRIRQIGTPSDIYDRPQNHFVWTFVGDANLFSALYRDQVDGPACLDVGDTRLMLETYQNALPAPGPETLFVRPEHCRLTEAGHPDIMQRSGALPAPADVSDILGLEVSGEIITLGAGVEGALLNQPVMALVKAEGYAEYVIAKADHCLPIPAGLSVAEAAGCPKGCSPSGTTCLTEAHCDPATAC